MKKTLLKPLLFSGIFFLGLVLLLKNNLLFSYEDKYNFTPQDISVSDYNVEDNLYTPVSEHSMMDFSDLEGDLNIIDIRFASPLAENTFLTIASQNTNGTTTTLFSKQIDAGTKHTSIALEKKAYKHLNIQLNHNFYLKDITLRLKIFNPLQRNLKWICILTFTIILSLTLGIICTKKSAKKLTNTFAANRQGRETNLELLRIICMVFIILHHCVLHGGAVSMDYSPNKLAAYVFLPIGKICFIAFIAISMWFLIDKEFKASRFLKTWTEVFFYSVLLTIVAIFLGKRLSIVGFFSTFLPITGNSHGFAASYLLFYLFLPFLSKATKDLNKRQARYLLMWSFYAQVLSQIIGYVANYYQPIFSELTLFIFCYILTFNLKKWPIKIQDNKLFVSCVFWGIWLLLLQFNYMGLWGKNNKITDLVLNLSGNESSLLIIIAGYALFFWFKSLKIKKCKYINALATYTFGILLMHDHNILRPYVWSYFVEASAWYYSPLFILLLIVTVICIFYVCSVIDYLRITFIETPLSQTKAWRKITVKWDSLLYTDLENTNHEE